MKHKRILAIVCTIAIIMLLPLVAMPLNDEIQWTLFDFMVVGSLLLGFGVMVELVMRNVNKMKYRIIVLGIMFVVLFLGWAELAVGIFGTPFAGS